MYIFIEVVILIRVNRRWENGTYIRNTARKSKRKFVCGKHNVYSVRIMEKNKKKIKIKTNVNVYRRENYENILYEYIIFYSDTMIVEEYEFTRNWLCGGFAIPRVHARHRDRKRKLNSLEPFWRGVCPLSSLINRTP